MNIIKTLPSIIVDQIAAGEVVEGPFSVVKELIENSIDAGSKSISIAIDNGGVDKIHIVDNGHGMSKDDLKSAFNIHLKLINFHDAMFCESSPGPVKFAAQKIGLCNLEARLPITKISKSSENKVLSALQECNLI